MPQAVTHILIAIIIADVIRDHVIKDRKKFSLHYVLIAGIAGLLPDIDIALYWILHFFGYNLNEVHRTFTHTIFFPALFVILALVFWKSKKRIYKLKPKIIFLMIALGTFIHLILDSLLSGGVKLFYPLSNFHIGLNLVGMLPYPLSDIALPCLDAALLVLWIIHEEIKHKISDFI